MPVPTPHSILPACTDDTSTWQIARRSDMDMNGHINNVVYIAWVVEAVPLEVYEEFNLYEVCPPGDVDSVGRGQRRGLGGDAFWGRDRVRAWDGTQSESEQ
eukprot:365104-Chlamydomonas_euryale.AAC.12